MAITANSGPVVVYGVTQTSTGLTTEYNEERAPSISDLGAGIMDPRPVYRYRPGGAVGSDILSHFDNCAYVDFVPTAISTNGLAANTQPVSNTAVTLTATGAGVALTTTIFAPELGQVISSNNFIIGSTVAGSTNPWTVYGQSGTVNAWNPQSGTGRNITISLSSNLDGGSYWVAGRDMYGFKVTEQLATAASTSIVGKKAFKYVSQVLASSTVTSTGVTVGYGDTYGFPLKLPYCGINSIVNVLATAFSSVVAVALSSATTTLASTVAVQTSTTPDVRGTYASTTASNGTVRLQIFQGMDAFMMGNISLTDTSALYGATQFSSV